MRFKVGETVLCVRLAPAQGPVNCANAQSDMRPVWEKFKIEGVAPHRVWVIGFNRFVCSGNYRVKLSNLESFTGKLESKGEYDGYTFTDQSGNGRWCNQYPAAVSEFMEPGGDFLLNNANGMDRWMVVKPLLHYLQFHDGALTTQLNAHSGAGLKTVLTFMKSQSDEEKARITELVGKRRMVRKLNNALVQQLAAQLHLRPEQL